MKYSLLIPCYNASKFIDKFITNLNLLIKPFDEVVFYDDASTDDTAAQLTALGYQVIKGKENKGPGYARNRLAEIAKYDYIHFHDIDDEFNPAFLTLVDAALETLAADIILGNANWIDELTKETIIQWRYINTEIQTDPLAYFLSNPLGIINTVYKKSIFTGVGGFNENIKCWEDADLHIRLAAAGASFTALDEVLAYSLRHDNGISKNQQWCWQCRLKFVKIYLQSYTNPQHRIVLMQEVKRIQNMFIRMNLYNQLGNIITLDKKYSLGVSGNKIKLVYYLSKIMPADTLKKALAYAVK